MIECTYVSSDISTQLAQERGHIHLADLAKRAPLLQAETIVLMVLGRSRTDLPVVMHERCRG